MHITAPLILDSENSFLQQRRKTTSLRSSTKWNVRSTRIRSPGARSGVPASGISTIEGQYVNATGGSVNSGKFGQMMTFFVLFCSTLMLYYPLVALLILTIYFYFKIFSYAPRGFH